MKELEGKKVFLRGTGNNARRGGGEKIIPAVINKVARVFATVTVGNSRYKSKYRINGRHLNCVSLIIGVMIQRYWII